MTLTLGELINRLKMFDHSLPVQFDSDWEIYPTTLRSYRGHYDQLALGYTLPGSATIGSLLSICESANGAHFEGHKGGIYQMDLETPVWAANYGSSTERPITGLVFKRRGLVILQTKLDDDEW